MPKKLHPPPVQFLIRTSAKFMIAHEPGLFLVAQRECFVSPFGQAVVTFVL
jgi:hypothetical protein